MPTAHIRRKRAAIETVCDEEDNRLIISRCALKDIDKRILTMILIERHDRGFVADTLGYDISTITRHLQKALTVFEAVAKKLHKM